MITFAISFIKNTSLGIIAWAFCMPCFSQAVTSKSIYDTLIKVEKDTSLKTNAKKQQAFILKKKFEDLKLEKDSVYARIIQKIGTYEFLLNNRLATTNAISLTETAIRINSAGKKNSAPATCTNGYTNLAIYYESLRMYYIAGQYFDSAIMYQRKYKVPEVTELKLLYDKAQMLFRTGDYEKASEQLNLAITKALSSKDSSRLQRMFNQKAQSNYMEDHLDKALSDIDAANNYSKRSDTMETLNTMVIKANILAKKKNFLDASILYGEAITQRLKTTDYRQISDDYTDLGNIYLKDLLDYPKAKICYLNSIKYALKANDFERLSKGSINLEQWSYKQQKYKDAERYCIEAFKNLRIPVNDNILTNPTLVQLNVIGNKELLLTILGNKTELLLKQFNQTKSHIYLSACLQTALLTDTIITNIRHLQLGESSKLYWRNRIREFFTYAMEACFLANDARLAFYFLEKSRAVLLSDQLNERRASANLPQVEAIKEHELQIVVISEQRKLSSIDSKSNEYQVQQGKLAEAKGTLDQFIKSLENKYPAYYQYKYADEVPTLHDLQKELLKNRESFVHYFMNDTVAYILGITPGGALLEKLSKDRFDSRQLGNFLQLCSNEPNANSQIVSFSSLSYRLYKLLFQPLNIPKGRVVICPDNFILPFEALCTDSTGSDFLINNYMFSYAFSARLLMKGDNAGSAKDDFIGFAPVSFKEYTGLPELSQSAKALKQSAGYYNNTKLFINEEASRHKFINAVSGYSILNVFSHAFADTTEKEPRLYMHDSLIYLSELQLIYKPATKLVVLSACQTNVGRNAKGEGIFSLARGFALSGIPSIATTLWNADEKSIYAISERFHEYLSQGMRKDEALQKAKLYFIKNGDTEKPFPYYWANMILVGNQEPIKLSENPHIGWWIVGIICLAVAFLLIRKK